MISRPKMALVLCQTCAVIIWMSVITSAAKAQDFVGRWSAESTQLHDSGLLTLEITKNEDGSLAVLPLGTSDLVIQIQRQTATRSGDHLTALWNEGDYRSGFFPLDFVGEVRGATRMDIRLDGADRLNVVVSDERGRHALVFRRFDDPLFRKFDVARLDANGQPTSYYAYRRPHPTNWAPAASATKAGIDEARLTSMVQSIIDGKFAKITAVSVVQDGKLVLDEYFFGQQRDDLHTVMSVTKSFTALAYGKAMTRYPQLALDTPVWRYFPELTAAPWVHNRVPVTVSQLLRMATVTPYDERFYDNPEDPLMKSTFSDDPVKSYLNFELSKEPVGDKLGYYTAYSMLVGEILGKVTSMPVDRLIKDDVLSPLAINKFAMPRYDRLARRASHPDGTFFNGSLLRLTALDLAKVGQMLVDRGKWRDHQVIPSNWIAAATTVRSLPNWPQGHNREAYGYGFWLRRLALPDGKTVWGAYMAGLAGQILFVIPQKRTVISINAINFGREELSLDLIEKYIAPAIYHSKGEVKWDDIETSDLGKIAIPEK